MSEKLGVLILSCGVDEKVFIGDDRESWIMVTRFAGQTARIAFHFPQGVEILRASVAEKIDNEQKQKEQQELARELESI